MSERHAPHTDEASRAAARVQEGEGGGTPRTSDAREEPGEDVFYLQSWLCAADECHICPLQLDLITRCLVLWSNPGDTVLSPFMGIVSEGVQSLRERRKFVGIELKESYFRQAVRYLTQADAYTDDLFSRAAE